MTRKRSAGTRRISIDLSEDAAVVFFDFLTRFSNSGSLEIQDQAEERVLWYLQCELETRDLKPDEPDGKKAIAAARQKVRDKVD